MIFRVETIIGKRGTSCANVADTKKFASLEQATEYYNTVDENAIKQALPKNATVAVNLQNYCPSPYNNICPPYPDGWVTLCYKIVQQ